MTAAGWTKSAPRRGGDGAPVTHGSSLFRRGNTQTLATATIGSLNDVQRLDAPVGPANKRLMLHYAFPSFSIDETPRRGV